MTWFLRDFLNISLVAYSADSLKCFRPCFFSTSCSFPGRLAVQNEPALCFAPWAKEVSCKWGLHQGTPKSHQPRVPLSWQPAEPHHHGCAFLPVIQGETNHQMFDLLTLLATLNILSCKLLQGFIFLSFHCLQLLVIVIIKHKWPLLHSARRALPWIKPNYRERVYMMILRVIQRVSCN